MQVPEGVGMTNPEYYPCNFRRDDGRCCNQAIDGNSNAMRLRKKEFHANSPFENIRMQGENRSHWIYCALPQYCHDRVKPIWM